LAAGALHLEWLSHLVTVGAVRPGPVLDLGPQDIQCTRAHFTEVAGRHCAAHDVNRATDELFDGESCRPTGQRGFYRAFGATSYHSLDATDPRADWKVDLNKRVRIGRRFQVVTNFGTAEHVFNVGTAFRSIHDLLEVGGVAIHSMPVFAFINHGYYNVHPNVFVDIARVNKYEIVDFSYIDNMWARNRDCGIDQRFDFGALPIRFEDMGDVAAFMAKVATLFGDNLRNALAGTEMPPYYVFDLLFVAVRKTSSSPRRFVEPIQGEYAALGPPPFAMRMRQLADRAKRNAGRILRPTTRSLGI
jgi:hypothetical protein